MNRTLCALVASCVWGPALLAATAASAQEAKPAPPVVAQVRLPPTVRLQLQPAAAPVPALKYTLLPPFLDRTPGNAAPLYYRAMLALAPRHYSKHPDEQIPEWNERPLAELPREEVRKWLAGIAEIMQEVRAGARREYCDWDFPIRGNTDLVTLRMEEIQNSRMIARILVDQARLQLLDGQFDEAVQTLQTLFSVAGHVNQAQLIVPSLVAVAFVAIATERILPDLAESPGSPNLYWALSSLPVPLIDIRRSIESESANAYVIFPFLRDARTAERTPEQWQTLLEGMLRQLARYGGLDPWFRNAGDMSPATGQLALAALTLKGYPRAKQHLIDRGLSREKVEKMPVGQVIAIYTADMYDELRDDILKWQQIPWPEANLGMERAEAKYSRGTEILPLFGTLTPSYRNCILAAHRAGRRIAEMRVIEALRLYAAGHDRQLPARLAEITEVPIPIDPLTGKEFDYRLEGTTAILEVLPPPGFNTPSMGKRYELTIAKP